MCGVSRQLFLPALVQNRGGARGRLKLRLYSPVAPIRFQPTEIRFKLLNISKRLNLNSTHAHTQPQGGAHQVVNANAVPALHDGQEGDEGGNDPAAANHQSHSHGRHLVAVDQGLAADGVVPAQTTRVKGTVMEKNM